MNNNRMTTDEFRAALAELGWTQLSAARALGISHRGYAIGDPIPAPTGKLLRLWLQIKRGRKVQLPA